jgi:hypothetical protein
VNPVVTFNVNSTTVSNGGVYDFGSVPSAPTCSANDSSACAVSGYSNLVGSHTLTGTATDVAGNIGTAQLSYQVKAWTLNGFYQPVDMDVVTTTGTTTALNTVKNGSTVPMKFNVLKGATQLTDNTNNAVVKSFTQQSVLCPSGAGVVTDEIEVTTTGGTSLRYDATAGQWIQNWQTPKKPNTCYNVTLTTQDGSKLVAHFQLK